MQIVPVNDNLMYIDTFQFTAILLSMSGDYARSINFRLKIYDFRLCIHLRFLVYYNKSGPGMKQIIL